MPTSVFNVLFSKMGMSEVYLQGIFDRIAAKRLELSDAHMDADKTGGISGVYLLLLPYNS